MLTANAGLDLFAVYRAVTLFKRRARLEYCDLRVFILAFCQLYKLISRKNPAGTRPDNYNVIVHFYKIAFLPRLRQRTPEYTASRAVITLI